MTKSNNQTTTHRLLFGFFLALGLLLAPSSRVLAAPLTETERIAEYDKRYERKWPPVDYVPNTEGWRNLMEKRFQQVREIDDNGKKYEGFMQTMFPAFLVQNYTEFGFGLARAPQELTEALQEGIRGGLARGEARLEHKVEVIEGPQSLFIDRPDLTQRVLEELQPYTETWAGGDEGRIPLTPVIAYGFRLYQNNSQLNMHVDKKQTHIISMIYHIDSSDDSEPWPIFIEDLHGRTHEVVLTPGDILFYESAKCLHGRPKIFNGSWYTSIFIHYKPSQGWSEIDHQMRTHYIIPPGWNEKVPDKKKTAVPIKMHGTSYKEPSCPNSWCATQNSIKWSGPGEDGFWIDANQAKHPFNPILYKEEL